MAPPLPDINAGQHLIIAFNELGRAASGGMALAPISWTEIQAFAEASGDIETPLEKRTLRQMSRAYVDGLERGKDALAIAPWVPS